MSPQLAPPKRLDANVVSRAEPQTGRPRSDAKRFLGMFLAAAVALTILLFAAVTFTDPHRYFFGSPVPQIWPNSPGRKVALFKAYSAHARVTGLFLGSSRGALIPPQAADESTGLRFFNATVYDASTDHLLAMYRLFRHLQGAAPKTVIVGVDTDLLSAGATVSEDLIANAELMSALDGSVFLPWHYAKIYGYYFRFQTIMDLRTSISNWKHPRLPLDTYLPDGHIEPRVNDEANRHFHPQAADLESFLVGYRAFTGISSERAQRLDTLFAEISADRARLVIWFTPRHPALNDAANRLPGFPAAERSARELVGRMASRYGATLVDLSDYRSFHGDPSHWLDAVHLSTTDARKELACLLDAMGTTARC